MPRLFKLGKVWELGMKILLYQWEAYGERALYAALCRVGLEVRTYNRKMKNQLQNESFLTELVCKLVQEEIQGVISYNFFPLIAMACQAVKIPYISWIFGAPDYGLYSDMVLGDYNFVFCFDRVQAEKLEMAGAKHAYHLPLAVDTQMFQHVIAAGGKQKESISFVGNLYTDENYYFGQIKNLPEYVKGYIDGLCEAQTQLYGCDLITGMLPADVMEQLSESISFHMDANYFLSFEQFMADILQKRVTVMERERLLRQLSEKFDVTLFTGSDTSGLPKVKNKGYIHYYDKMPSVFAGSAINLNITLRSILTGIPLRVLDIAACGGFLMSNYQEELAEHFRDGEEIVLFTGEEDLEEKCAYYLKHESERQRIAARGYERVKRDFTYEERICFILEQVNREMK